MCAGVLVLLSDGELSVSDVGRLCVAGQGGHERREKSEGGHEHCALLYCDLVSAVVEIGEGDCRNECRWSVVGRLATSSCICRGTSWVWGKSR